MQATWVGYTARPMTRRISPSPRTTMDFTRIYWWVSDNLDERGGGIAAVFSGEFFRPSTELPIPTYTEPLDLIHMCPWSKHTKILSCLLRCPEQNLHYLRRHMKSCPSLRQCRSQCSVTKSEGDLLTTPSRPRHKVPLGTGGSETSAQAPMSATYNSGYNKDGRGGGE